MILNEHELVYAEEVLRVLKPLSINDAITIVAFVLRTISSVAEGDLEGTLEARMQKFVNEADLRSWQLH